MFIHTSNYDYILTYYLWQLAAYFYNEQYLDCGSAFSQSISRVFELEFGRESKLRSGRLDLRGHFFKGKKKVFPVVVDFMIMRSCFVI